MQIKSKKDIVTVLLSVLVCVFLVSATVQAAITISGTTITLSNSETITNTTDGTITLSDGTNSILIKPTGGTGIDIGDAATTGIDVGTATTGIALTGTQTTGISVANTITTGINFAGGAANQAIKIGTRSSTTPASGALLVNDVPTVEVNVDDNNVTKAQGSFLTGMRVRLMKYASSITEDYAIHGLAKFASAEKGGWGAGVMGAVETTGTVALAGQSDNLLTGVLGRFGTSATLNTNTANDRIACVTAFNNNSVALTGSGKSVGLLVMEAITGTPINLDYGVEVRDNVATTGLKIGTSKTAISADGNAGTTYAYSSWMGANTEARGIDLTYTATLASSREMVGINAVVTPAGTAGVWVSGIYAKVDQDATKHVNGYMSGAEFEVANAAANPGEMWPLVLNLTNNAAQHSQHEAYIALRDYGSLNMQNLLYFGGANNDAAIGNNSAATLLTTHTTAPELADYTHAIRIMINNTPYWIPISATVPH